MSLWRKVDNETLEMLKEQRAFEEETARRLTPLYTSLKNPLVKLFIQRIIFDTMKHSDMYQTLIDVNDRVIAGDIDRKIMTEELTSHIQEETRMLNKAIKVSKSIKDENLKKLMRQIIEDEKIHHKILEELSTILEKEAEEWNLHFYEMMKDYLGIIA